jgi:hypothetical protein
MSVRILEKWCLNVCYCESFREVMSPCMFFWEFQLADGVNTGSNFLLKYTLFSEKWASSQHNNYRLISRFIIQVFFAGFSVLLVESLLPFCMVVTLHFVILKHGISYTELMITFCSNTWKSSHLDINIW